MRKRREAGSTLAGGLTADPDGPDGPSAHGSDAKDEAVEPAALTDGWDMAELLVDQACHGIDLVGWQSKPPELIQVLDIELHARIYYNRPAAIAELTPDLGQLIRDNLPQNAFVLKNILELGDVLYYRFIFVENFLAFKGRQASQLEIEDRLGLYVRKIEAGNDLVEFR